MYTLQYYKVHFGMGLCIYILVQATGRFYDIGSSSNACSIVQVSMEILTEVIDGVRRHLSNLAMQFDLTPF